MGKRAYLVLLHNSYESIWFKWKIWGTFGWFFYNITKKGGSEILLLQDMKGSCATGTSCADGVCVAGTYSFFELFIHIYYIDAAARKFRYLFWWSRKDWNLSAIWNKLVENISSLFKRIFCWISTNWVNVFQSWICMKFTYT